MADHSESTAAVGSRRRQPQLFGDLGLPAPHRVLPGLASLSSLQSPGSNPAPRFLAVPLPAMCFSFCLSSTWDITAPSHKGAVIIKEMESTRDVAWYVFMG